MGKFKNPKYKREMTEFEVYESSLAPYNCKKGISKSETFEGIVTHLKKRTVNHIFTS